MNTVTSDDVHETTQKAPMTDATPIPSSSPFVEFITLRRARAFAKRGNDDMRENRAASLTLSKQKLDSAEVLWGAAHPAEAMALAVEALDTAVHAFELTWADAFATDVSDTSLATRVHLAGAKKSAAEQVARVVQKRGEIGLPTFDAEVVDGDADAYAAITDAARVLHDIVGRSTLTLSSVRRSLAMRYATLIAAALSLVGLTIYLIRDAHQMHTIASAYFDNDSNYGGAKATDGDPNTEWLLPDHSAGNLDIELPYSQTVHSVTLLNAHNSTANDRGTKNYRVVLFAGDKRIASRDGSYTDFSDKPTPVYVKILGQKVTRVRIEVLDSFKLGGGFAEVTVQ